MIHQPMGQAQGQASDIQLQAKEILRTRQQLNQIYAETTGLSIEEIGHAVARDNFMTPQVAKEFGLIDSVIKERPGKEFDFSGIEAGPSREVSNGSPSPSFSAL
jgi:ATP-dependent Clp protease protease subunit